MIQLYFKDVTNNQYESTINLCILIRKLGIQTRIKSIDSHTGLVGARRTMQIEVDRGVNGKYDDEV